MERLDHLRRPKASRGGTVCWLALALCCLAWAGCSGLGATTGNGKTCRFGEPFEPSGAAGAMAPPRVAPQQAEPPQR